MIRRACLLVCAVLVFVCVVTVHGSYIAPTVVDLPTASNNYTYTLLFAGDAGEVPVTRTWTLLGQSSVQEREYLVNEELARLNAARTLVAGFPARGATVASTPRPAPPGLTAAQVQAARLATDIVAYQRWAAFPSPPQALIDELAAYKADINARITAADATVKGSANGWYLMRQGSR